jgi:outer membrane protein
MSKMKKQRWWMAIILVATGPMVHAQVTQQTRLPQEANLEDVIAYALQNAPTAQQATLDKAIGEREIASALSGWFPQIGANAGFTHNIKIPTTVIGDQVIQMGQKNSGFLVLQADQQILNPGLLQASKAAKYVRERYQNQQEATEIRLVVDVSKAYYDILTSKEQENIMLQNIARLQKQYDDAQARYDAGLVDRTDAKRAQISLSNAQADLKRIQELLVYKHTYLKELIGLQNENPLHLAFSSGAMESQLLVDTLQQVQIEQRIEFQQLQVAQAVQRLTTQYHKWTFLPSVSANYNYAWDVRSNAMPQLFDRAFPRSVAGLTLQLPIFQGTKRIQEIRKSQLLEQRLSLDETQLINRINSEYARALATYKSSLNDLKTAQQTVQWSEEVYELIKLQYDEGIKTYLDLMNAETDLRTSQINYLNALYAALSGKLDVQQALGQIDTPSSKY